MHFVAGRAAQAVAMIGFTLVAVRVLPPSDFATYMLAFGLIEAGRPLVSLGLVPMLQQFLPDIALHGTSQVLRRTVAVGAGIRLLLTALLLTACYAGWNGLLSWLGATAGPPVPAWLVCAVVAASLMADYSVTILEALMQQRIAQPLRAALPIGKLCALLTLHWNGTLSLERLLWVELALATACAMAGEWSVRRMLARQQPDATRQYQTRMMVSFAWHMSGAQLLATAANPGVVRMVAARGLGVEALAQFAFLQQLALYVTRFMPSTQFASLIRPMLVARQATGQVGVVSSAMALMWKANLVVALVLFAAAAAGGGGLATWLYGREVVAGGLSILLMLTVPAFVAQENLASTMLQLQRETRVVRRLNLLALFVPAAVLAGSILASLPGAIAGLSLALGLQSTVTLAQAARFPDGMRLDGHGLLRAMAAAALAVGAVAGLHHILPAGHAWHAPTGAVVSGVLSLALLFVFKPLDKNDAALVGRTAPSLGRWIRMLQRQD